MTLTAAVSGPSSLVKAPVRPSVAPSARATFFSRLSRRRLAASTWSDRTRISRLAVSFILHLPEDAVQRPYQLRLPTLKALAGNHRPVVQLGIGQGLPRTYLAIPLPYIFELLWKGWDLGKLLRLPPQRLPNLDQAFPEGLL